MNLYMVAGKYILANSVEQALKVSGKKNEVVSMLAQNVTNTGKPRQITTGEARELMND